MARLLHNTDVKLSVGVESCSKHYFYMWAGFSVGVVRGHHLMDLSDLNIMLASGMHFVCVIFPLILLSNVFSCFKELIFTH